MKKIYKEVIYFKSTKDRNLKTSILLLFLVLFSTGLFAQSKEKLSLNVKNVKISKAIEVLQKQTSLNIVYNSEELKALPVVSVNLTGRSLSNLLDQVLAGTNLTYTIKGNTVVIGPKAAKLNGDAPSLGTVSGKVLDEEGGPLAGASVSINGTKIGAITNAKGEYVLNNVPQGSSFLVSYIGYKPQVVFAKHNLKIRLVLDENKIEEVVVTGTGINRKVSSFTGITSTFTGAELKAIGNNNIISSLKSLDPAFQVIDNELKGSNPNVLPTLELRGKTTTSELSLKDQFGTDPNQPLFVLDGFETNLQTIIDLDMNRVASVTILKDAASTALYGSKAANGVIVIETIKPVAGKLRFSYSNDLRIEGPDLSVYNMMNAKEKLEFERLSGRYKALDDVAQIPLDSIYNLHLAAIARGVDTYWLADPLRNIVSENHSLNASGGDEAFRYSVNFNYKTNPGVMKGSARDSWGSNINLIYRKNNVNITNSFSVDGNKSTESPYGSFQTYVNTNPYYEKNTTSPSLDKTTTFVIGNPFLTTPVTVSNPLYNASLPFKNESEGMKINNNLMVMYDINAKFRLSGGLSLSKGVTESDVFTSPDNTMYSSLAPILRGKYSNAKSNSFSYSTNAVLSYGNVFANRHSVTANIRGQIGNNYSSSETFIAQGFPSNVEPLLRFAYGYELNGLPNANNSLYRNVNATGSVNYSYASRYLFDASYRLDGSTSFGKNNPWSPYWSTGIGWNVHNEAFMKKYAKFMSRLKLTSNIGVTGNQTMGAPPSSTVYQYLKNYNVAGLGIFVSQLGNPDLLPSRTTQISNGIDFGLWHDRFTGSVTYYTKNTDNQVVSMNYPTSTGISSYNFNVGHLITKGAELKLNYAVINDREHRIVWRVGVTGARTDSKYSGFGPALAQLDASQISSKALTRFRDGSSPNDLYTAVSLGIDPATGREMFLTANGEHTLDYSQAYQPKVGSAKPLMEGVISNNFNYKKISLSIMMRYRAKSDVFNSALLNKVENLDYSDILNNQDKRALYDRWKNPGDISQFKGISLTTDTPMSTRFLQEENTLSLESINVSYMFQNTKWMKAAGLQNLNLSAFTNDIARFSTVKRERGTDYPFARSVSFSLKASF
ncbi:SusC/RagA family TonB-linked outer membrane protein [Solitalea koreensis]|uniref:TonB-linked outer membrane protein, SusC/RagA family n=1 Tax=Solitalea koreensis TaxID=543615 RepID=A0A521AVL4_9SPHI|nr:SusC/RagA family TonB-linked outer membrane protein [Solitalea koreensis]SMO38845.1 TonB-linked outer membrane protein, SusC/RagA family [Solitalea koreensis]